ncbi:uncharacterized protein [Clytia hemisphaerica]
MKVSDLELTKTKHRSAIQKILTSLQGNLSRMNFWTFILVAIGYLVANPIIAQQVDGGYGPWSEWTPCEVTCGDGLQYRERGCNEPSPSNSGLDCEHLGPASETKPCRLRSCRGIDLKRGNFLKSVDIQKTYQFTFEIKPTGIKEGWTNVFHGYNLDGNCCHFGQRIPALFMRSNTSRLMTVVPVGNNSRYQVNEWLPMHEATNVTIRQSLRADGTYRFALYYNETRIDMSVNTEPRVYKNVSLYASDKWYQPSQVELGYFNVESPIEPDYFKPQRGFIRQHIPLMDRTYEISFTIQPNKAHYGNEINGVFRISHNETLGSNCCKKGSNIPNLLITDRCKLYILNDGNKPVSRTLNPFRMTSVKIRQELTSFGLYSYTIHLDGKEVHQVFNQNPATYKGNTLYTSDPYHNAADVIVQDLKIVSPLPMNVYVPRKNNYITNIPVVEKAFRYTMEIKPVGVRPGWTSIFHATRNVKGNRNCCGYGSRIPALFFHSNTTKLHTTASINGRGNFYINNDMDMDRFTVVTIEQSRQHDGQYRFSLMFDYIEVYTVINKQPEVFKDVSIYIGDPWYEPSNVVVRNFHFENLHS